MKVPVAEKVDISSIMSWRHGRRLEKARHEFLLGRASAIFIVQTGIHLKIKGSAIGATGTM